MKEISFFVHENRKEYFFVPWHGYRGACPSVLPTGWVAATMTLPHVVSPRPCVPNGVVLTRYDMVNVYYPDYKEINPL